MPEKVLLIGPVNGRLKELISKVSAIQSKHGPFAALFIVGDLFHPSPSDTLLQQQTDLLEGNLILPVSTLFYQGTSPLHSSISNKVRNADAALAQDVPHGLAKVVENLFYAKGKSGVFATSQGLRVAFAGGRWDAKKFAEDNEAQGSSKEFDPKDWFESEAERSQDEELAHITPATINRLLAHPSFRLPSSSVASSAASLPINGGAKPGTLAAARASASQDQARAAAQTAALDLLKSRPSIDLLLTNCWPTGITLFYTYSGPPKPFEGLPDPTARMWGSPAVARLAAHACPRYHFALGPSSSPTDNSGELPVGILAETVDMGAFWERTPYETDLAAYLPNPPHQAGENQRLEAHQHRNATRFVSLAKFANEKKTRWFLALNLTPADQQSREARRVQGDITQTPYFVPTAKRVDTGKRSAQGGSGDLDAGPNFRFAESGRNKRQRGEGSDDMPPKGYVCRICNVEGHYIRACPSKPPARDSSIDVSTGSNTLSLPSDQGNEGGKNGWSKSTMPLPVGLPAKPSFASSTHHHSRRQMIPVGPSNCWFCLSNPSVEKSLIVTIGAESYLVFPKGPFSHPSINAIPHGASHLLIVPLTHTSNLLPSSHPVLSTTQTRDEQEDQERKRVRNEMEETKSTVRQLWKENDHVMLEWTLVRVRTSSRMTHMQTQLVALLSQVVRERGLVQKLDDAVDAQGSGSGNARVLRNPAEIQDYFDGNAAVGGEEDGYFHLVLHAEEKNEWLVPLNTSHRFPVQFIRTTLSYLLDVPHLADWKTATTDSTHHQDSSAFRSLLLSQTA